MIARIGIATAGMILLATSGRSQTVPEAGSRALWDSEFLRQRPAPKTTSAARPEVPRPTATRRESVPQPLGGALVGLTVWQLRRSAMADEPGARVLVHSEKGDQEWTPERVSANTPLAEGQRFRFSLESARAGYLYVIDREEYADGSFGDPHLIFPTAKIRGGHNRVSAGTVVELPSWDDSPPYVWLKRSRPDHVAEVLTILVTPAALEGLRIGPEQLKLSAEEFATWQKNWGADVKSLSAPDQAGKAYTQAEKFAAEGYQDLTEADPTPQTLFLVPAKDGEPLLVNVRLPIRK